MFRCDHHNRRGVGNACSGIAPDYSSRVERLHRRLLLYRGQRQADLCSLLRTCHLWRPLPLLGHSDLWRIPTELSLYNHRKRPVPSQPLQTTQLFSSSPSLLELPKCSTGEQTHFRVDQGHQPGIRGALSTVGYCTFLIRNLFQKYRLPCDD